MGAGVPAGAGGSAHSDAPPTRATIECVGLGSVARAGNNSNGVVQLALLLVLRRMSLAGCGRSDDSDDSGSEDTDSFYSA